MDDPYQPLPLPLPLSSLLVLVKLLFMDSFGDCS